MATESPVTIAEAKAHLRVDHNADDALIDGYLVAAAEWFENETRRKFAEMTEVPQLLKQGVLMLAAHYYEAREGATDRRIDAVPFAIDSIVAQHRFPEAI